MDAPIIDMHGIVKRFPIGTVDFTMFLNYFLILKCLLHLLNVIVGSMNRSLQICNMILEVFVV